MVSEWVSTSYWSVVVFGDIFLAILWCSEPSNIPLLKETSSQNFSMLLPWRYDTSADNLTFFPSFHSLGQYGPSSFLMILNVISLAVTLCLDFCQEYCTYGLLTKCEVKMAGYWPSSFFACLWTETKSRSINSQKKSEANIQPSWPNKLGQ